MQPPRVEVTETGAISERQLVRGARAGDRRAFAALARLKVPESFRLAAAILGDQGDAADATQNALVAAWRELPRFRDVDRFDPWLRRILVNECRMQLRHVARPTTSPRDSDELAGLLTSRPSTTARSDVLDILERAFEQLEAGDRILVVLHLLEHQSLREMAEALHMPVGTAKLRLHEARQALHGALGAPV